MAGRARIRREVAEALALVTTAGDGRLSEGQQRALLESGVGRLAAIAGGPAAVAESERRMVMRLREQNSASANPALQRGGRSRANDRASLPELAGIGRRGGDVSTEIEEATLTSKQRKSLSTSQFAIPERRAYPIHDESHARNALSRVSQHGSDEEKRRVRAAVKRKYPHIGESDTDSDDDERDDGEHEGRALDEQGGDHDDEDVEESGSALASELIARGRGRRRESGSLLDRVTGGARLRETSGPAIDLLAAMHLDRG